MISDAIYSAAEMDGLLHVENHTRHYKIRSGLSIQQLRSCAGIQTADIAIIKLKSLMLRRILRRSVKMDRLLMKMSAQLSALVDSITDQITMSEDVMAGLISWHETLLPTCERFGVALRSRHRENAMRRTFMDTMELLEIIIEDGDKFSEKFVRLEYRNHGSMETIREIDTIRSSRIGRCVLSIYYETLLPDHIDSARAVKCLGPSYLL